MNKVLYVTLSLFALMLFQNCNNITDNEIEEVVDPLTKSNLSNKTALCHLNDEGEYVLLIVNKNAVKGHLKHGDKLLDIDGDGFTAYDACFGSMDDCDDNDPNVNPGMEEICDDGIDNNCNGLIDEDCGCDPVFYQDFQNDHNGWYSGNITLDNGYAIFRGKEITRFGGYLSTWPGEWRAEIDVYLDPEWTNGMGFDYSVAANGSNSALLRDFIFHVVKDISEQKLLVCSDTRRTRDRVRYDIENEDNFYVVKDAAWYKFQHIFYNVDGVLNVDLNLLDENNNILFTETISNTKDLIPQYVGGNRYGSFLFNNIDGGIKVDESKLYRDCDNLIQNFESIF